MSSRQANINFWQDNVDIDLLLHWTGDRESLSRNKVVNYIMENKLQNVLECGAGMCVEYNLLRIAGYQGKYTAIDVTKKFVEAARVSGVNIRRGNINRIHHEDNSFDLVFCRHVLEHLYHFKMGLKEMIRVSSDKVIVVFFMPIVVTHISQDYKGLYTNSYSQIDLETWMREQPKIDTFCFEPLQTGETMLYINLKKSPDINKINEDAK